MSRKVIIASVVLIIILTTGAGVWYVVSRQLQGIPQKQGATKVPTNDLWQKTRVYKNDEFGFSFQYPKDWFLEEIPKGRRGALLLAIYNWDPNKFPEIPEDKMIQIDCLFIPDAGGRPQNVKERIIFLMDTRAYVTVKNIISEIDIVNGEIYLAHGITHGMLFSEAGKEYDIGTLYLAGRETNYLIYFVPKRLPDNREYYEFLKRITAN